MRRLIMFMLIVAFTVSFAAMPISAKEADLIQAELILSHKSNVKSHAIKVLSTEILKAYMDEYHDNGQFGYGFDISKYDAAFFQKKALLLVFANAYGSYPAPTISSIKNTEAKIVIEYTRLGDAYTADMSSWMLVLEMDRDMSEKEIWLNGSKIAEPPYATAIEHDYHAVITNPTCTEEGFTRYTCARCGDQYDDNRAPALGHDYTATLTEPTCTDEGYITYVCSRCGHSYIDDRVPALKHDYLNGICTICGAELPRTFIDVPTDAWYANGIEYVSIHDLMNGVGENRFAPDGTMSRAMLVTVLWRYADKPVEKENLFTDVPTDQWYTEAVNWAAKNGIVTGIGNGKFDPEGAVTREQMIAILYRFTEEKEIATKSRDVFSGFEDGEAVHEYAVDAMKWAIAKKLIIGSNDDNKLYLNPNGSSTRSQVATVLMRYFEGLE